MRELRLGIGLGVFGALIALGCDGGGRGTDSGTPPADTGVMTVDSGPPRDSGPPMDSGSRDGGGGGGCRPPLSECDLVAQDCAPGSACRYVAPAEREDPRGLCETPAGTRLEGESCTRDETMDTCAEGMICRNGTCRRHCCANSDCPVLFTVCVSIGEAGLCLADDGCNPVDGSGCPDGQACYTAGLVNLCSTAGIAGDGELCAETGCIGGFGCLAAMGEQFTCKKLCDLTMGGAGCASGQACTGRIGNGEDPPQPRADVGFCEPMP